MILINKIFLKDIIKDSGICFGTSGARGLVSDMTDRVCWAYTTAFLQEVTPGAKRVVLGHDLRPSSPAIIRACAAAAQVRGMDVEYAGALPTPALAYYALQERMPAVMVTGSHIPFDRNGIKFYTDEGEISKDHETAITQAVVPDADAYSSTMKLISVGTPLTVYRERYLKFFPVDFLSGIRIGVYEHSSVARDFLTELLKQFGAEVVSLGRTNSFVPIDTEAVSEEDQALGREWVSAHRLNALLSTDGDADRPLIGDETGRWLRGDVVGLLCARYLNAQTVVTPVSSTTAIERCGAFTHVLRTKIGSPYVISGMEAAFAVGEHGVVGFEANGGFLVGNTFERNGCILEPLPTRDAVLPMLALLALAQERGVPLSALVASLPQRFTASDRIKEFPTERSQVLITKLASSRQTVAKVLGNTCGNVVSQDETDGLRLTFASGQIIHLRPSGNAPELRCYAETDSEEQAKELVRMTLDRVLVTGEI
ncbi:phosphomannomutase [Nitrosomonas sp. Is37]|uniref:phosphomannomutase n=1 Tax=Nitrosomonas sp. Is37 TaxID=3080535 RepID=UPI00294AD844|nr:phosphomannomutase [Nitrosomonas sp. Is37]MDV6344905.1 phosphomannomutase [Nitrosomonas sp. Is37]